MASLTTHFTVAEEQTSASYSLVDRSEQRLDSGPPAIIVDIDGTLIFNGEANQRLLAYLDSFDDAEIIIVTARLSNDRDDTLRELDTLDIDFNQLIMKPNADTASAGFKGEVAASLLEDFNVMVAIDNDPDNREVYRGLGITALDVDDVPDVGERRLLDLTPPAWVRAIARSAANATPEILAVTNNAMTPAMWVEAREMLADSGNIVWGVVLTDRAATRFLDFANEVIGRIEEENEGRAKGQALSKMETRINSAKFEVRETDEGMQFSGYAAVFNSDSEPLPFIERIAPGAFKGSLRNRNDIKLLWNHDTASVLGSTRAGTLRVTEDARGLYVEADLPNTSTGRDARELIGRGDVDSMSFGFTVSRNGDEWSADGSVRTLTKINLHEVSIVAFPAYTATAGSTTVRGIDKVALRAGVDADVLADALLKIENGEDITSADRQLLASVIDELAPAEQVEQPKGDLDMLALKKKKLELLMGL